MSRLLPIFCAIVCFPCHACWIVGPNPAHLEKEREVLGQVPPAAPAIAIRQVSRGDRIETDSCSDTGVVSFEVPWTEEAAALAYEFEVVSGVLDEAIRLNGIYRGLEPKNERKLVFPFAWIDGVGSQKPLDFQVRITPVRLSGLKGESVTIQVTDPGK